MKIKFNIAKYKKTDNCFIREGYSVYDISFIKSNNANLRILVNDKLTNQKVNICNFTKGYKKFVLEAISEFVNNNLSLNDTCTNKKVQLDKIKLEYGGVALKNVKNYNKEESRDILTQYKLI